MTVGAQVCRFNGTISCRDLIINQPYKKSCPTSGFHLWIITSLAIGRQRRKPLIRRELMIVPVLYEPEPVQAFSTISAGFLAGFRIF
jgi:hypothetical protein